MGTPNIAGQYKGPVSVVVRASQPGPDGQQEGKVQAYSSSSEGTSVSAEITFDFDNKAVILQDGLLTPKFGAPMSTKMAYEARGDMDGNTNVLSMQEDPDVPGNYIVSYYWKVESEGGSGPSAGPVNTSITLEITQLIDDSIAFVTYIDPEGNGIPGTALPGFPLGATPDWRGRIEKI